jgi:hypothetical protein
LYLTPPSFYRIILTLPYLHLTKSPICGSMVLPYGGSLNVATSTLVSGQSLFLSWLGMHSEPLAGRVVQREGGGIELADMLTVRGWILPLSSGILSRKE